MTEFSKIVLEETTEMMDKVIAHFEESLLSIRAGRASVNVLNGVMLEYYGNMVPVSQVASITIPDARTVLIQPWEKGQMGAIEKAIINSNIGLTPSNNGEHIRLSIPPLTEERRMQLVKQVKGDAESARVSIRNARRDAIEAFKKAQKDGMPEDAAKDGETNAQKLTDTYSKRVDEMVATKEEEIMTV